MDDRLEDSDVGRLLDLAGRGDPGARGQLLARYRDPLKSLAASKLDRRMASRLDPSDVAQEALAEADRRLGAYLRDRPLPFYPWLVQFARDILIDARRKHLGAASRSVLREEKPTSGPALTQVSPGSGPIDGAIRRERRAIVRAALDRLGPSDREVLLLRHSSGLSVEEAASRLGLTGEAVKSRHRRALERLRVMLEAGPGGLPS